MKSGPAAMPTFTTMTAIAVTGSMSGGVRNAIRSSSPYDCASAHGAATKLLKAKTPAIAACMTLTIPTAVEGALKAQRALTNGVQATIRSAVKLISRGTSSATSPTAQSAYAIIAKVTLIDVS